MQSAVFETECGSWLTVCSIGPFAGSESLKAYTDTRSQFEQNQPVVDVNLCESIYEFCCWLYVYGLIRWNLSHAINAQGHTHRPGKVEGEVRERLDAGHKVLVNRPSSVLIAK